MEFVEEYGRYVHYFKVALAIAIFRQKPKNFPAKQYTVELAVLLQEKQQDFYQKVQQLQTELFLTKQALVQTQLSSKVHRDLTTDILPSPPLSSEDSKANKEECCHLLKHANFLKSVSFMCNESNDLMSMFAGDDITVVKKTLITMIKRLTQDSVSKFMALPQNVLQLCANGMIAILECPSLKNYQSELKVPALILVKHLIQMILNDSVDACQVYDKISRVIVVLGCTPTLTSETLTNLATSVIIVSLKLCDVAQGGCSIRSLVSTYHSIYHVLWAIETILTKTISTSPRPGIVVGFPLESDLTKIMGRSLLHISRSFPVYASYVWRIQVALVN